MRRTTVFREEPPDHALISPQAFADWLQYAPGWKSLDPLMLVVCPLCLTVVPSVWQARCGHVEWHIRDYFELASRGTS